MTDRVCFIEITGAGRMPVYEVHETTQDERDWLTQVIKFTNKAWPNFQHQVMGRHARLKSYQLYATIFLKPGFVLEDADGKYQLVQALPNLVD
ncbi:hypothetical protein BASA81_003134 [Batrachochytrium salamandrivorans]|nr:hypothetical protein BASA81_003134 [Batrachochytrium salamandrivorans]